MNLPQVFPEVKIVRNSQKFNCISSREIARLFNREHGKVTRLIDSLVAENLIRSPLSGERDSKDSRGRVYRQYLLTDAEEVFKRYNDSF